VVEQIYLSNCRLLSRNSSLRSGSIWKEVTCQAPLAAAQVDTSLPDVAFWRLLLSLGVGVALCWILRRVQDDIILLPPHLTHLIQPLDVSVFSVFKHHHKVCTQDKVRTGDLDFSVFDFLSAFQRFHKETFTYSTLLNGWKVTGLDSKHVNSSVIIARR